jgi:hypothetical protein
MLFTQQLSNTRVRYTVSALHKAMTLDEAVLCTHPTLKFRKVLDLERRRNSRTKTAVKKQNTDKLRMMKRAEN